MPSDGRETVSVRLDAAFTGPAISLPVSGLRLPLRLHGAATAGLSAPLRLRIVWRDGTTTVREDVVELPDSLPTGDVIELRADLPTACLPPGRYDIEIVAEAAVARLTLEAEVHDLASLPPSVPCPPDLLRRRSLADLPVLPLAEKAPAGEARIELRQSMTSPRANLLAEDLAQMLAAGGPAKTITRSVILPPSSVYVLHEATLLGPHMLVATPHGLLDESWNAAHPRTPRHTPLAAFAAPRAGLRRRSTVALAVPQGRSLRRLNHFHFHAEHLSGLLQIEALRAAWGAPSVETVLPEYDPLQQEAVDLLGADLGEVRPIGAEELIAETLIIPSLAFRSKAEPDVLIVDVLRRMRRNALAALTEPQRGGRLVYVSRLGSPLRRMRNEEQLVACLRARGFDIFDARGMGYRAQVLALAQARVILAPHGAGIINAGFAPDDTLLVEFFSPYYYSGCFMHMAGMLGHRYRAFLQAAPAPRDPTGSEWDLDIDRLLAFLDPILDAEHRAGRL